MNPIGRPRAARWIPTHAVAQELGVCKITARKLLTKWRVPHIELSRTDWRWDKAAYEAALKTQSTLI